MFFRKFLHALPLKMKTNSLSMINAGLNDFPFSRSSILFAAEMSVSTVTCSNSYYNIKCPANHFKPL